MEDAIHVARSGLVPGDVVMGVGGCRFMYYGPTIYPITNMDDLQEGLKDRWAFSVKLKTPVRFAGKIFLTKLEAALFLESGEIDDIISNDFTVLHLYAAASGKLDRRMHAEVADDMERFRRKYPELQERLARRETDQLPAVNFILLSGGTGFGSDRLHHQFESEHDILISTCPFPKNLWSYKEVEIISCLSLPSIVPLPAMNVDPASVSLLTLIRENLKSVVVTDPEQIHAAVTTKNLTIDETAVSLHMYVLLPNSMSTDTLHMVALEKVSSEPSLQSAEEKLEEHENDEEAEAENKGLVFLLFFIVFNCCICADENDDIDMNNNNNNKDDIDNTIIADDNKTDEVFENSSETIGVAFGKSGDEEEGENEYVPLDLNAGLDVSADTDNIGLTSLSDINNADSAEDITNDTTNDTTSTEEVKVNKKRKRPPTEEENRLKKKEKERKERKEKKKQKRKEKKKRKKEKRKRKHESSDSSSASSSETPSEESEVDMDELRPEERLLITGPSRLEKRSSRRAQTVSRARQVFIDDAEPDKDDKSEEEYNGEDDIIEDDDIVADDIEEDEEDEIIDSDEPIETTAEEIAKWEREELEEEKKLYGDTADFEKTEEEAQKEEDENRSEEEEGDDCDMDNDMEGRKKRKKKKSPVKGTTNKLVPFRKSATKKIPPTKPINIQFMFGNQQRSESKLSYEIFGQKRAMAALMEDKDRDILAERVFNTLKGGCSNFSERRFMTTSLSMAFRENKMAIHIFDKLWNTPSFLVVKNDYYYDTGPAAALETILVGMFKDRLMHPDFPHLFNLWLVATEDQHMWSIINDEAYLFAKRVATEMMSQPLRECLKYYPSKEDASQGIVTERLGLMSPNLQGISDNEEKGFIICMQRFVDQCVFGTMNYCLSLKAAFQLHTNMFCSRFRTFEDRESRVNLAIVKQTWLNLVPGSIVTENFALAGTNDSLWLKIMMESSVTRNKLDKVFHSRKKVVGRPIKSDRGTSVQEKKTEIGENTLFQLAKEKKTNKKRQGVAGDLYRSKDGWDVHNLLNGLETGTRMIPPVHLLIQRLLDYYSRSVIKGVDVMWSGNAFPNQLPMAEDHEKYSVRSELQTIALPNQNVDLISLFSRLGANNIHNFFESTNIENIILVLKCHQMCTLQSGLETEQRQERLQTPSDSFQPLEVLEALQLIENVDPALAKLSVDLLRTPSLQTDLWSMCLNNRNHSRVEEKKVVEEPVIQTIKAEMLKPFKRWCEKDVREAKNFIKNNQKLMTEAEWRIFEETVKKRDFWANPQSWFSRNTTKPPNLVNQLKNFCIHYQNVSANSPVEIVIKSSPVLSNNSNNSNNSFPELDWSNHIGNTERVKSIDAECRSQIFQWHMMDEKDEEVNLLSIKTNFVSFFHMQNNVCVNMVGLRERYLINLQNEDDTRESFWVTDVVGRRGFQEKMLVHNYSALAKGLDTFDISWDQWTLSCKSDTATLRNNMETISYNYPITESVPKLNDTEIKCVGKNQTIIMGRAIHADSLARRQLQIKSATNYKITRKFIGPGGSIQEVQVLSHKIINLMGAAIASSASTRAEVAHLVYVLMKLSYDVSMGRSDILCIAPEWTASSSGCLVLYELERFGILKYEDQFKLNSTAMIPQVVELCGVLSMRFHSPVSDLLNIDTYLPEETIVLTKELGLKTTINEMGTTSNQRTAVVDSLIYLRHRLLTILHNKDRSGTDICFEQDTMMRVVRKKNYTGWSADCSMSGDIISNQPASDTAGLMLTQMAMLFFRPCDIFVPGHSGLRYSLRDGIPDFVVYNLSIRMLQMAFLFSNQPMPLIQAKTLSTIQGNSQMFHKTHFSNEYLSETKAEDFFQVCNEPHTVSNAATCLWRNIETSYRGGFCKSGPSLNLALLLKNVCNDSISLLIVPDGTSMNSWFPHFVESKCNAILLHKYLVTSSTTVVADKDVLPTKDVLLKHNIIMVEDSYCDELLTKGVFQNLLFVRIIATNPKKISMTSEFLWVIKNTIEISGLWETRLFTRQPAESTLEENMKWIQTRTVSLDDTLVLRSDCKINTITPNRAFFPIEDSLDRSLTSLLDRFGAENKLTDMINPENDNKEFLIIQHYCSVSPMCLWFLEPTKILTDIKIFLQENTPDKFSNFDSVVEKIGTQPTEIGKLQPLTDCGLFGECFNMISQWLQAPVLTPNSDVIIAKYQARLAEVGPTELQQELSKKTVNIPTAMLEELETLQRKKCIHIDRKSVEDYITTISTKNHLEIMQFILNHKPTSIQTPAIAPPWISGTTFGFTEFVVSCLRNKSSVYKSADSYLAYLSIPPDKPNKPNKRAQEKRKHYEEAFTTLVNETQKFPFLWNFTQEFFDNYQAKYGLRYRRNLNEKDKLIVLVESPELAVLLAKSLQPIFASNGKGFILSTPKMTLGWLSRKSAERFGLDGQFNTICISDTCVGEELESEWGRLKLEDSIAPAIFINDNRCHVFITADVSVLAPSVQNVGCGVLLVANKLAQTDVINRFNLKVLSPSVLV